MKKYTILISTLFFVLGILLSNCGNPSTEKTHEAKHQDDQDDGNYHKLGAMISRAVRIELGNNLVQAISSQGTAEAIGFCNTRAISLTDSVAQAHHAKVKRVSDKPRNPDNRANETELPLLGEWKKQEERGDSVKARVLEHNGKMIGYYPIKTNGMCLQCHGTTDKDIRPEVYTEIKKRYPSDQATGYGTDQLRGMFVVEMDKN